MTKQAQATWGPPKIDKGGNQGNQCDKEKKGRPSNDWDGKPNIWPRRDLQTNDWSNQQNKQQDKADPSKQADKNADNTNNDKTKKSANK